MILMVLILLLIERQERKGKRLILMVETLLLVVTVTSPIFRTSFDAWDGVQPIPLFCAVVGSILLCITDRFVGQPFSTWLGGKSKAVAERKAEEDKAAILAAVEKSVEEILNMLKGELAIAHPLLFIIHLDKAFQKCYYIHELASLRIC